jgi:SAM-dependent methyltransferase
MVNFWLIFSVVGIALLSSFMLTLLFLLFSNIFSHLIGAPAISSPPHQLWKEFADPEKSFLDLGCGRGLVCQAAAPHFKHVYGIEYSPWYYLASRWQTRQLKNVTIIYGNILTAPWPPTDYIYCYLLPGFLKKIKILLKQSQARLLSLSFQVEGWQPKQVIEGNGKKLYVY